MLLFEVHYLHAYHVRVANCMFMQAVIKKKYGQDATNVGDEGGFAPNIQVYNWSFYFIFSFFWVNHIVTITIKVIVCDKYRIFLLI